MWGVALVLAVISVWAVYFSGNKLTEQMTGRTFYPDMLMKANFRECEIVTVARVLNEGSDSVVYDMEAAAVYQAAAFFVGPHRMHFIKACFRCR